MEKLAKSEINRRRKIAIDLGYRGLFESDEEFKKAFNSCKTEHELTRLMTTLRKHFDEKYAGLNL